MAGECSAKAEGNPDMRKECGSIRSRFRARSQDLGPFQWRIDFKRSGCSESLRIFRVVLGNSANWTGGREGSLVPSLQALYCGQDLIQLQSGSKDYGLKPNIRALNDRSPSSPNIRDEESLVLIVARAFLRLSEVLDEAGRLSLPTPPLSPSGNSIKCEITNPEPFESKDSYLEFTCAALVDDGNQARRVETGTGTHAYGVQDTVAATWEGSGILRRQASLADDLQHCFFLPSADALRSGFGLGASV
ncbi:hypothetical protein B0H13DRAFT_1869531 [Mycena leptocephala]|nr:hypothetical protein B0H13DRAFT_1869531 [Mycena leptocephala]